MYHLAEWPSMRKNFLDILRLSEPGNSQMMPKPLWMRVCRMHRVFRKRSFRKGLSEKSVLVSMEGSRGTGKIVAGCVRLACETPYDPELKLSPELQSCIGSLPEQMGE